MANIPSNLFKDWNDGETITEADYEMDREIIRTAVNDNYAKLLERYTKAEVDSLLSSLEAGVAISIRVESVLPAGIEGAFVLKTPENNIYYYINGSWLEIPTSTELASAVQAVADDLSTHIGNISNPHGVTTSQIGAIPIGEKGSADGIAPLNTHKRVPYNNLEEIIDFYKSQVIVGDGIEYYYDIPVPNARVYELLVPGNVNASYPEGGLIIFDTQRDDVYGILDNYYRPTSPNSDSTSNNIFSVYYSGSFRAKCYYIYKVNPTTLRLKMIKTDDYPETNRTISITAKVICKG